MLARSWGTRQGRQGAPQERGSCRECPALLDCSNRRQPGPSMTFHDRIIRDPAICRGQPVIRGTGDLSAPAPQPPVAVDAAPPSADAEPPSAALSYDSEGVDRSLI